MSNNDDFDFNRDDLFDDFDDDSGSDDFGADDFDSDNFDFGDDSEDFNLDDDDFGSDLDSALAGDDDGGDDDFGTTENAGASGGGTSRNFLIVAVMMFVLFLVGIGLLVYALFFYQNPADAEYAAASTSIALTNEVALTQIAASATAAIDSATGTAVAEVANATATEQAIIDATASYVPPTATPTEDFTATAIQETQAVLDAQATTNAQVAIDATNTEIAFQMTQNPSIPTQEGGGVEVTEDGGTAPEGGTPVSLPAVQQTATALAQLFAASPTPSGGEQQATDILEGTPVVIGGGTPSGTGTSGSGTSGQGDGGLPDTGLFDDVFQGNPSFIFLAAFGLLGVIVFSRSVRSRKNDE